MMYQAYQAQTDLMWPLRAWARVAAPLFLDDRLPATGRVRRRSARRGTA